MLILKQLRKERKMSQEELANLIGYSRTMIAKWETGKLKMTVGQKIDVAEVFNVDANLLNEIDPISGNFAEMYVKGKNINKNFSKISFAESLFYVLLALILVVVYVYVKSDILLYVAMGVLALASLGIPLSIYSFWRNNSKLNDPDEVKWTYLKKRDLAFVKEHKGKITADQALNKYLLKTDDK